MYRKVFQYLIGTHTSMYLLTYFVLTFRKSATRERNKSFFLKSRYRYSLKKKNDTTLVKWCHAVFFEKCDLSDYLEVSFDIWKVENLFSKFRKVGVGKVTFLFFSIPRVLHFFTQGSSEQFE